MYKRKMYFWASSNYNRLRKINLKEIDKINKIDQKNIKIVERRREYEI